MNWIKKSIKNKYIKSIILLFGIVLFYNCSARKNNNEENTKESVEEIDFVDYNENLKFHQKLNIDSLLNSYNSIDFDADEGMIIPLDTVVESDSSRVVVLGKFINNNDVFALDIYGTWQKQRIDFYKFEKGVWNILKSDSFNEDVLHFSFENFNNDNDSEILFLGHPNMNCNRLHAIFKYNSVSNEFEKSGSYFCDELNFDLVNNRMNFEYGGSWYMPNEKSKYKWVGNKIIPIKKVSLELKKYNYKSHKQWISFYENPTQDKDTLVLKFRKTYGRKGTVELWENFFEH